MNRAAGVLDALLTFEVVIIHFTSICCENIMQLMAVFCSACIYLYLRETDE